MNKRKALVGCQIFDGEQRHDDCALLIEAGRIAAITPIDELARDVETIEMGHGLLAPGFIDLQVNGGGGVLFSDQPDIEAIKTIIAAHSRFGSTAMMITLISQTPEIMSAAIKAGIAAQKANIPGFLGLHLEGPHLAREKCGAHNPDLLCAMSDSDIETYKKAAASLQQLIITVAPEVVTPKQISALKQAGIMVSLGHSNATYAQGKSAIMAGAGAITHLFNAMSPLHHRDPGLVGVALENKAAFAGLIADGHHVSTETVRIALRARNGPGKIFLITDAMSTIGTDLETIMLYGHKIYRKHGRLTLADGTLAGADLDMLTAVRFMVKQVGVKLEEALRMASLYPAQCINAAPEIGRLLPGSKANIVQLDDELKLKNVWIEGKRLQ